jgi:hypothetical protein
MKIGRRSVDGCRIDSVEPVEVVNGEAWFAELVCPHNRGLWSGKINLIFELDGLLWIYESNQAGGLTVRARTRAPGFDTSRKSPLSPMGRDVSV